MKKILLIKTVFCPNRHYFDITNKSIIKTGICMQLLNNITYDILLIGWIYTFTTEINNLISTYKIFFKNIFTDFWAINYGKYKCINNCIDFLKNNSFYDFIIFMDHDIYFDAYSITYINNMLNINELKINDKKIAIKAFNHKQDNRHQTDIYDNYIFFNDLHINYSVIDGSIATGAYMIETKIFMKLTYLDVVSVYGLDDYYLCKKFREMGYLNIVISNCYVIHPFDNNKLYNSWKKQMISDLVDKKNVNYYLSIENSINILTN